ncbi:hypothetical protein GEV33_009278 [Tenebrio molitor]|uniref:Uncharacterized protein n=1 Tax=Tenebrio molitor TaxID=7067 RepID=A0A8J6HH20_TENMO|nr:hypothetical protein GEV33_009278 [Tenebrio molitor]
MFKFRGKITLQSSPTSVVKKRENESPKQKPSQDLPQPSLLANHLLMMSPHRRNPPPAASTLPCQIADSSTWQSPSSSPTLRSAAPPTIRNTILVSELAVATRMPQRLDVHQRATRIIAPHDTRAPRFRDKCRLEVY